MNTKETTHRIALLVALAAGTSCAHSPREKDSRAIQLDGREGAIVEIENVEEERSQASEVTLHFYFGSMDVPMKPVGGGIWRADLSSEQLRNLPRDRHGFRVYRAELRVRSADSAGHSEVSTYPMTISIG